MDIDIQFNTGESADVIDVVGADGRPFIVDRGEFTVQNVFLVFIDFDPVSKQPVIKPSLRSFDQHHISFASNDHFHIDTFGYHTAKYCSDSFTWQEVSTQDYYLRFRGCHKLAIRE